MNLVDETHRLDTVVRALSTAGKSLRLYPAASPIPRQSAEAAAAALDGFFASGEPVLALQVEREGFTWRGTPVGRGTMTNDELVSELRDHGVAELAITPGCSLEELLEFMAIVGRSPAEVREAGGLSALLASAGIDGIRVTDVHLTVAEQLGPAPDEDVDEFLRQLANDPEKLAAWFAAAAAGDPRGFEEGLMELVRVAGPSGYEGLLTTLAGAFLSQDPDAKDVMLGLAMDPGASRDLTGGMFRFLASGDIAGAVLGGTFGRNMLSLSNALTALPLEQVTAQVRAEVQAMLPGTGHTPKEAQFLEHMIEVRERTEPEQALVDADRTYRAVLEASTLSDEVIEQARSAVTGAGAGLSAASVRTMLTLLDQQRDFELYCATADSLAAMVPQLIEQGDLMIAGKVLSELSSREALNTGPWPELSARLRESLAVAGGPRSMAALVRAVAADPSLMGVAADILRHGSDAAPAALVAEAISLKEEGLRIAEQLLGRRVIDQLNALAPQAQWFQLGPVVARLAQEGDARSLQTIEALMRRPDEQSRREVVGGLALAGGPNAMRLLGAALRDPSAEVGIVAARAIGRSGVPGSAAMLAARLGEIDLDDKDYLLGRELITSIARIPEREADDALAKIAGRKSLMKRGHFSEVQELVREAQEFRAKGGQR